MQNYVSLLALAIGLSADALAVTISNCLRYANLPLAKKIAMPVVFGLMQGVMPLIGFFLGSAFSKYIQAVDHWIALILLTFLGVKMIVETIRERKVYEEAPTAELTYKALLVQGVATSIDALAVGLTLAVAVEVNVFVSAAVIALVTGLICLGGIYLGKLGKFLKGYAGIVGGIILVAVGVKIFVEHVVS